ncbi:MAG: hypothetical protein ACK5MH_09200 [Bacteroidales bacterium]
MRDSKIQQIKAKSPIAFCKINDETGVVSIHLSNSKKKEFDKMSDAVNYCKENGINASINN